MKGSKGIDNPAFVASSPDTPRRLVPSPSHVEVSVLTRREDSQPQEPQKSPDLPLSSVTTPGSQEGSGPVSQSEFEEGPCGWGNFQPQCFQRCNTPRGFLFHYCLLALTQGKVPGRLQEAQGRAEGEEARGSRQGGEGRCAAGPSPCGRQPREVAPDLGFASARSHRRWPCRFRLIHFGFCFIATVKTWHTSSLSLVFYFSLGDSISEKKMESTGCFLGETFGQGELRGERGGVHCTKRIHFAKAFY